jgi:hypothetical protein
LYLIARDKRTIKTFIFKRAINDLNPQNSMLVALLVKGDNLLPDISGFVALLMKSDKELPYFSGLGALLMKKRPGITKY